MATPKDFYVTVSSNASTEFYPSNKVNHFFNRLSEPIQLSEANHWEVALTEVMLPPTLSHLDLTNDDLKLKLRVRFAGLLDGKRHHLDAELQLKPFADGNTFTKMF